MKRVTVNTVILLTANLSGAAFGFLMAVLIGRALGDVGLGRYAFVMAWTYALGIFAEFGLGTLVTRDIARRPQDADRYLIATTCTKIAIALILIAGLEIIAPAITRELELVVALRLGALLILLSAVYGSFTAIFRAFERMLPVLFLNSGALFVQFIGTIILLANGFGVIALIALALFVQSLQIIAAYWLYRSSFRGNLGKIFLDIPLALKLSRAALPFAAAGIISAIELRANVVLLGLIQDDRSVGWFSAATRFSEGSRLFAHAIFGAAFPAFSAMAAALPALKVKENFHRLRGRIALCAFIIAIALTVLAQPLLAWSFGSNFLDAQPILIILAWSLVPGFANGLTVVYLYALGRESDANRMLAFALAIQLLFAIPLIQSFAATGAAVSAMIGDLFLFVFLQRILNFQSTRMPVEWKFDNAR